MNCDDPRIRSEYARLASLSILESDRDDLSSGSPGYLKYETIKELHSKYDLLLGLGSVTNLVQRVFERGKRKFLDIEPSRLNLKGLSSMKRFVYSIMMRFTELCCLIQWLDPAKFDLAAKHRIEKGLQDRLEQLFKSSKNFKIKFRGDISKIVDEIASDFDQNPYQERARKFLESKLKVFSIVSVMRKKSPVVQGKASQFSDDIDKMAVERAKESVEKFDPDSIRTIVVRPQLTGVQDSGKLAFGHFFEPAGKWKEPHLGKKVHPLPPGPFLPAPPAASQLPVCVRCSLLSFVGFPLGQ